MCGASTAPRRLPRHRRSILYGLIFYRVSPPSQQESNRYFMGGISENLISVLLPAFDHSHRSL